MTTGAGTVPGAPQRGESPAQCSAVGEFGKADLGSPFTVGPAGPRPWNQWTPAALGTQTVLSLPANGELPFPGWSGRGALW